MNVPSDEELDRLRERIAAHPSDLPLRLALGELLLQRQDYAQAISELHQAMNDSKLRRRAGEFIAQAFDARKMPDAAARMRRSISGDDSGDDGSAPVRVPVAPRPPTLPDSSVAKAMPHDDEQA